MRGNGKSGPQKPLLLLDIHHSGYLGWGVWCGQEKPEAWTAETVERLVRHKRYKMGLNLGAQTYEWSPQFASRIRKWLADFPDRFFITGGDYAQPTACVRTGESNLRQILYGLEVIRDHLGVEVSIWTVSEPGNFSQLPQVLLSLGYRGAVMRVHGPGQQGSLTPRVDAGVIWWEGPDGSRIKSVPEYTEDRLDPKAVVPHSMWMMTRYRNPNAARGNYTLDDLWKWKEAQEANGITPVVMSKDDDQNNQPAGNNLCMTSGHLLAADTEDDERFRWVTVEELFDCLPEPGLTLAADPNLFETRKFSFCDYGYRSNADWISDFQAEAALRMGDFSTVMADRLGTDENYEGEMREAWKRHLMAQNHDLTLKSTLNLELHLQYEAQRLAEGVRDRALKPLFENIDTGSDLGAVVVFNPLGWNRTDYAQISLPADIAERGRLFDGEAYIPWEIVRRDAERVIMGFVAKLPALGYRAYIIHTRDSQNEPPQSSTLRADGETLRVETGHYIAQLLSEGGIKGIWTKEGTCVADFDSLRLSGDIGGDFRRSQGRISSIQVGPISATAVEEGRIGPHYRYQMTYRFTDSIPYIAIDVSLMADFRDGEPGAPDIIGSPDRKLGVGIRFPEIMGPIVFMRKQPFLVWRYDPALDPVFASLYWVDLSGPDAGITMLNKGTIGYRWDPDEREISNILASGRIGEMSCSFGLLPHDGNWLKSSAHQVGLGFGNPFYCAYEPAHPGNLPRKFQLCSVEPGTVTVSSVFRANGKTYIRLFEHAGRSTALNVNTLEGIASTKMVDLRLRPIEREQNIRAHEIVTLELDLDG